MWQCVRRGAELVTTMVFCHAPTRAMSCEGMCGVATAGADAQLRCSPWDARRAVLCRVRRVARPAFARWLHRGGVVQPLREASAPPLAANMAAAWPRARARAGGLACRTASHPFARGGMQPHRCACARWSLRGAD